MKLVNIFLILAILGTAAAFTLQLSAGIPTADVIVKSTSISTSLTSHTASIDRRSFIHSTGAGVAGGILMNVRPAVAEEEGDFVTAESGLQYKVLTEGTGAVPQPGQTVKAHYTGWLDGFNSPKKFDSSRDRGRPFTFAVGKGQVIRGWDESFSTMKVGERRQIILPARLAYGDRGAGGIIPGGATLYFDVELLGIL